MSSPVFSRQPFVCLNVRESLIFSPHQAVAMCCHFIGSRKMCGRTMQLNDLKELQMQGRVSAGLRAMQRTLVCVCVSVCLCGFVLDVNEIQHCKMNLVIVCFA